MELHAEIALLTIFSLKQDHYLKISFRVKKKIVMIWLQLPALPEIPYVNLNKT